MVRIELLYISSSQPNRSSYSKSQAGEALGDHDYTIVENTALVSHDGIITEKFPDTSYPKMKLLLVYLPGKALET